MPRKRPAKTELPEPLADAIRQAWPDNLVEMPADMDEAPFWDLYPKLKAALSRIPGTTLLYEHEPHRGQQWGDDSGEECDPTDWVEGPRSYHLFFICPLDGRFRFETDTIEADEDGVELTYRGEGTIGCVLGVSLAGPLAIVALDQREVFENGSMHDADVEPHIFSLDGQKLDMEEFFREFVEEEGLAVLRKLRASIVRVLKGFGISVIPEEHLDKPVPWLRADDEIFVGHAGEPVTVRTAFFFRGI